MGVEGEGEAKKRYPRVHLINKFPWQHKQKSDMKKNPGYKNKQRLKLNLFSLRLFYDE